MSSAVARIDVVGAEHLSGELLGEEVHLVRGLRAGEDAHAVLAVGVTRVAEAVGGSSQSFVPSCRPQRAVVADHRLRDAGEGSTGGAVRSHIAPSIRAASSVFSNRQAMVIGPVPPGIGVIAAATCLTVSKSTSPTMPASVRETPTSMTAAPGLTWSAVMRWAIPAAPTRMSALRQTSARFGVREWASVTVASVPLRARSRASGSPTSDERPNPWKRSTQHHLCTFSDRHADCTGEIETADDSGPARCSVTGPERERCRGTDCDTGIGRRLEKLYSRRRGRQRQVRFRRASATDSRPRCGLLSA